MLSLARCTPAGTMPAIAMPAVARDPAALTAGSSAAVAWVPPALAGGSSAVVVLCIQAAAVLDSQAAVLASQTAALWDPAAVVSPVLRSCSLQEHLKGLALSTVAAPFSLTVGPAAPPSQLVVQAAPPSQVLETNKAPTPVFKVLKESLPSTIPPDSGRVGVPAAPMFRFSLQHTGCPLWYPSGQRLPLRKRHRFPRLSARTDAPPPLLLRGRRYLLFPDKGAPYLLEPELPAGKAPALILTATKEVFQFAASGPPLLTAPA
ncbi:UNVERIFIED_CONTAM: hypothetical protein FKN15_055370 [Acipenser sinensis]